MRILRSLLFVPGNSWRMIERAKREMEDAAILDMEDAVPISEKETARWFIKDSIEPLKSAHIDVFIRVNSLTTGLTAEDLNFAVQKSIDGIVLPKSETREDILKLERMISEEERSKGIKPGSINILPLIETARGVLNAYEIAIVSKRLVALGFGATDYLRDLGRSYMDMSMDEMEILYPRSYIALASRVAGIPAIDTPYLGLIINKKELIREAKIAVHLGFKGKFIIHPTHIDPVNQVFTPSNEEIKYARKIVEAYEDTVKRGLGATSLEGRMIDYATYEMSRELISFAETVAKKETTARITPML